MSILDSVKSKLTSAIEAVKSTAAPVKSEAPAVINTEDKARTSGKATAGSTVVASLDSAPEAGNVSFASMTQMVHGTQAAEKPENDAGNEGGSMMGGSMMGGGLTSSVELMEKVMRDQGASEEEIQAMKERVAQQDQEMFSRMFGNAGVGKEGITAQQGGGLTSQLQLYAQFMRDQGASEEEIQAMFDKVRQTDQEMFSRMFTKDGHLAGGLAGMINGNGGAGSAEEGSSDEPVPAQPGHNAVRGDDPEKPTIPGLEPWTPGGNHDPGFTPTIPTVPGVQIPGGLNPGNQDPGFTPTIPEKPGFQLPEGLQPLPGQVPGSPLEPSPAPVDPGTLPPLQPLPGQNPPPGLEPWTPGGQKPNPGNPPVHPLPGTQLPPGLEPWTPGGQKPNPGNPPVHPLPGTQLPPGLEPWTPGGQKPQPGNPPVHPLPGTQLPPGLEPWTPGGQKPNPGIQLPIGGPLPVYDPSNPLPKIELSQKDQPWPMDKPYYE